MARKSLIHQIEARERRGRWFGSLAVLLSMSLLLSGWVGLFAFLGINSAYGTFEEIKDDWVPDTSALELTLPDLSRVSRIYADTGELLAELHDGRNQEPIPYDRVPEVVVHAILAAEDKDFFEHEGIDFSAIASAALDNLLSDSTRGGSTITQQVVKNAFVGAEISLRRKVTEAFVAAEVEKRFSKDRILEYYINSVYFGAGAYGVKTASEEFFGKPLDRLAVHEAALLAVLVRNPRLYNPRERPELSLDRRNTVIDQMMEKEWITDEEADEAKARPLGVIDSPLRRGQADHVVAEVKRQLLQSPTFAFLGDTNEERKRAIFGCPADDVACEGGGGLQVFTTIDLRLQNEANSVLNQWLPMPAYEANLAACGGIFDDFEDNPDFYAVYAETHSCEPTGAISMVDNHTGAVKVMASGLPFEFTQFDLAIQGRRNPGSAAKVFGLVAALEQGYTLGHTWNGASPTRIQCEFACAPDGSNVWTVHNANRQGTGVIDLDQATYRSVNTVFAQVSEEVGPDNVVDVAKRMGIKSPMAPVLSIVLGSGAVSTLEMASAYSNFATNGLHAEAYVIDRILDHEGNVIYQHEPELMQVSDPAVFAAARRPLLKVPTQGTAASVFSNWEPDVEIGGKTGTHQSFLDAYYVGFSPDFTTAVWVGYEAEQIPLVNVVINGQNYNRVFGGSVPAPIWKEFMTLVLRDFPSTQYPVEPANIDDYLVPPPTTVPNVVGLEQAAAINRLRDARLNASVQEVPSLEEAGIVVSQSIEGGSVVRQGTTVTIFVSSGVPPVGPLPNFVGITFDQAVERAVEFEEETGVRLTLIQRAMAVDNPDQVGRVVESNPAAGSQITGSANVVLFVGELAPQDDD